MKNFLFFVAGFATASAACILFVILGKSSRRDPSDRIELTEIVFPNSTIKGAIRMFTLKEGQRVLLRFIARTRRGNVAAVENLTVSSSDDSVIGVTAHESEANAYWAEGLDGSENETVLIEARGDADLGEGVKEIIGTTSGVCTQGDAVTFEIEVGEPEDVPTEETAGGESQTIGSGDVGSVEDVLGSGLSSGAGGTANQGVEENPSAGAGDADASGTTDPEDSNQPPAAGDAMTFSEAADKVPGESKT